MSINKQNNPKPSGNPPETQQSTPLSPQTERPPRYQNELSRLPSITFTRGITKHLLGFALGCDSISPLWLSCSHNTQPVNSCTNKAPLFPVLLRGCYTQC